MGGATLGPRHRDVRRLRSLLRDARARTADDAFVLEGPRVVQGALDRGARLQTVYLATGAARAFPAIAEGAERAGIPIVHLRDGVIEKVSTTRTPQPVLAEARRRATSVASLSGAGTLLVTVDVSDPGNLGTIIRSAEASGADGVVVTGDNAVDVHHPKVVRSTAGAIFGVAVAQESDPVAALRAIGEGGRRRLATLAHGGEPYDGVDLAGACALVLGNEARGLGDSLTPHLDGAITIPVAGRGESLNVAMAAAVLCFEAARQRRAAAVSR